MPGLARGTSGTDPRPDVWWLNLLTLGAGSSVFSPTWTWPWSAVISSAAPARQLLDDGLRPADRRSPARRRSTRRSRARGRPCRCRRSRRTRAARPRGAARRPRPAGSTRRRQPSGRDPRRCAAVNALASSSALLTTGTAWPRNGTNGCMFDRLVEPPAVALSVRPPPQDVQHVAADVDAVADQAVLARRQPGRDRRQRGGGGGRRDRGDRAAVHRRERRREVASGSAVAPIRGRRRRACTTWSASAATRGIHAGIGAPAGARSAGIRPRDVGTAVVGNDGYRVHSASQSTTPGPTLPTAWSARPRACRHAATTSGGPFVCTRRVR